MRTVAISCLFLFVASDSKGQSPEPPISDTRLSVSTLLREDIFAGWRASDMDRLARAEKNIELLLRMRPNQKPDLLAWKGSATMYRAVLAHEAGKSGQFDSLHTKALALFAEARKLGPMRSAVAAVVGGTYALFADRLPKKHRRTAWADSYTSYKVLWSQQSQVLEKLPLHTRGELLAGLAQASQRTGRSKELDIYLDKILTLLPDTRYARVAKSWKEDPEFAARSNISCKYCHKPGRLSAKLAALKGK